MGLITGNGEKTDRRDEPLDRGGDDEVLDRAPHADMHLPQPGIDGAERALPIEVRIEHAIAEAELPRLTVVWIRGEDPRADNRARAP